MYTHFHRDPKLYWKVYEKDQTAFQVVIVNEEKKFLHYKLTTVKKIIKKPNEEKN